MAAQACLVVWMGISALPAAKIEASWPVGSSQQKAGAAITDGKGAGKERFKNL